MQRSRRLFCFSFILCNPVSCLVVFTFHVVIIAGRNFLQSRFTMRCSSSSALSQLQPIAPHPFAPRSRRFEPYHRFAFIIIIGISLLCQFFFFSHSIPFRNSIPNRCTMGFSPFCQRVRCKSCKNPWFRGGLSCKVSRTIACRLIVCLIICKKVRSIKPSFV